MARSLISLTCAIVFALSPCLSIAGDEQLFLGAFAETGTAYLNDSFLLLGATADGFVADIMSRETALEISKNVQKRIRVVRGRLKAVSACRISEIDKRLLSLLDHAFASLDHLSWALVQYVQDRSPDGAKRFEAQRVECLERIRKIAEFYSTLPPSPELPEPLSTR